MRTIIDHYAGAVDYLELFNEVDRDPQFLVEGSPYSRKTGYQAVARRALNAVDTLSTRVVEGSGSFTYRMPDRSIVGFRLISGRR